MEDLGNSMILNLLFKPAAILMGSRIRSWLMNPMKTLQGAGMGSVLYRLIIEDWLFKSAMNQGSSGTMDAGTTYKILGKPKFVTFADDIYNLVCPQDVFLD